MRLCDPHLPRKATNGAKAPGDERRPRPTRLRALCLQAPPSAFYDTEEPLHWMRKIWSRDRARLDYRTTPSYHLVRWDRRQQLHDGIGCDAGLPAPIRSDDAREGTIIFEQTSAFCTTRYGGGRHCRQRGHRTNRDRCRPTSRSGSVDTAPPLGLCMQYLRAE